MTLAEFRELTKDMPDDTEIIIDARTNPCGNCWEVLTVEATSRAFFGEAIPAVKLSEATPEYGDEDSDQVLYVDPNFGQWAVR